MNNKRETTELRRYTFNADQYYKMAEVGILPWGHGEELISGVVCDRSPLVRNRCHSSLNGGITRFLNELAGLPEELDQRIHKYTVEEYHVMGETGILTEEDRVQLIDGEIVEMPPMSSSHASIVNRLIRFLNLALDPGQAVIWGQCPITFPDNAEPEPDVAILKSRPDFYRSRLPTPQDALLLIEVSQSTLRLDRSVKVPYYAHQNIPEVWVVNLPEEIIKVYRNPRDGVYQETTRLHRGDTLSPQAFPAVELTVEEIFG